MTKLQKRAVTRWRKVPTTSSRPTKRETDQQEAYIVMRMFVRLNQQAESYRLSELDQHCVAKLIGRLEYLHFGGASFSDYYSQGRIAR